MDQMPLLQSNRHWRTAVLALRFGYLAVAIIIVGLIMSSAGSTSWVLAVGVLMWLAAAGVTMAGFLRGRHDLPEPRPGFWPIRAMLIRDTVRPRPRRKH